MIPSATMWRKKYLENHHINVSSFMLFYWIKKKNILKEILMKSND